MQYVIYSNEPFIVLDVKVVHIVDEYIDERWEPLRRSAFPIPRPLRVAQNPAATVALTLTPP